MNVFISYRHFDADTQFADRLVATLRGWGHSPWIDRENLLPGADWVERINEGLKLAQVIVGILSDKSIESRMVLGEWLYALENKIPLILVRLRPCVTPYPFNTIQYVDYAQSEASGSAMLQEALKSPKPVELDRVLAAKTAPTKIVESTKLRVTNRATMLQKVFDFWIKGVLEPAKLGDVWLDLHAEQRPEAVEPEAKRNLRNPDFDMFSLGADKKIGDVFRRMGNELLILGAPGSGKTMTLLELARDLIAQAQQDDQKPIPVVFNLASWAEKHPERLEAWLVERLFLDYNVPRKLGQSWIDNAVLLFLFDGLDEVALSNRDACVSAINQFWRRYDQIDNGIAVCSRIADYESLSSTLHLENAILLSTLSAMQVEDYLVRLGHDWDDLRAAIPGDAVLRTFAESPLLLTIMAVAYRNTPREQIVGLSETDQKRELLNRYVARRLREDTAPDKYPKPKTQHYLSWLAKKMVEHQQIVFQIEGLQPEWLDMERSRQRYRREIRWDSRMFFLLLFVLIGGPIGGLCTLLAGRMSGGSSWRPDNELNGVLIGALLSAGLGVLFVVLFVRLGGDSISSIDRLSWSWHEARKRSIRLLASTFVTVVWVTLCAVSEVGGIGLILGLIIALSFGALIIMVGGLTENSVAQRTTPNQGIYQSARNALVFGLVGGLAVAFIIGLIIALALYLSNVEAITRYNFEVYDPLNMLLTWLVWWSIVGLYGGLIVALVVGLRYGAATVIKHVILRRILAQTGVAPLNYAEFLDYCASRQLMRRVGGGYIFRHRMLMEYFAEKER